MKTNLHILFFLYYTNAHYVDLACYKKAYQSTEIAPYSAGLAVDGNDTTCSLTNSSYEPSWLVVDLKKKYLIEWIYIKLTIKSQNQTGELKVLLVKEFDINSSPPNTTIHHTCWSSLITNETQTFDTEAVCFQTKRYRYVALWVSEWFQLEVNSFEAYEYSDPFLIHMGILFAIAGAIGVTGGIGYEIYKKKKKRNLKKETKLPDGTLEGVAKN